MKKRVGFRTLGCRLNQFETDSLLTDFYRSGYEIVNFNEEADIYIINTCTVTSQGDHKSRTAINKALRNKEGSLVVVTGCCGSVGRREFDGHLPVTSSNAVDGNLGRPR